MRSRSVADHLSHLRDRLKYTRVVYTDLDNTLLGPKSSIFATPEGKYSLKPAAALLTLIKLEVDVVLVSGRNDFQLREIARLLGLKNYISELGCLISYEQGKEIVRNYHYPVPESMTLHEAVASAGAPAFLLNHFQGRLEYHTPWAKNQKCTHLFRGLINVRLANRLLAGEGFRNLRLIDNGNSRSQGNLKPLPEIHVYHLLPKDTNKASAIMLDQNKRGLMPSDTIALGDSLADLEMAGAVGTFFMVADGIAHNPRLNSELLTYSNAYLTTKKMGMGWAEVAKLIVGRK